VLSIYRISRRSLWLAGIPPAGVLVWSTAQARGQQAVYGGLSWCVIPLSMALVFVALGWIRHHPGKPLVAVLLGGAGAASVASLIGSAIGSAPAAAADRWEAVVVQAAIDSVLIATVLIVVTDLFAGTFGVLCVRVGLVGLGFGTVVAFAAGASAGPRALVTNAAHSGVAWNAAALITFTCLGAAGVIEVGFRLAIPFHGVAKIAVCGYGVVAAAAFRGIVTDLAITSAGVWSLVAIGCWLVVYVRLTLDVAITASRRLHAESLANLFGWLAVETSDPLIAAFAVEQVWRRTFGRRALRVARADGPEALRALRELRRAASQFVIAEHPEQDAATVDQLSASVVIALHDFATHAGPRLGARLGLRSTPPADGDG
jgi:hypothetical protein